MSDLVTAVTTQVRSHLRRNLGQDEILYLHLQLLGHTFLMRIITDSHNDKVFSCYAPLVSLLYLSSLQTLFLAKYC